MLHVTQKRLALFEIPKKLFMNRSTAHVPRVSTNSPWCGEFTIFESNMTIPNFMHSSGIFCNDDGNGGMNQ